MDDKQIFVFEQYFFEIQKISNHLSSIYGFKDQLFERKAGIYFIFKSLFKNLKFLSETKNEIPYTAFVTLSRMIIDHYSVLYIMSSFSTIEAQKLRYYLLMISSLEGRLKTICDFEKSLINIPMEIIKKNQELINYDNSIIEIFLKKIKSENLNEITTQKNILKRNWKFPIGKKAGNGNFYNWQELYQIAKIPENFTKPIQQHFSEFTHGLGLTLLYSDKETDSKLSIIALLSVIQSLIGKIMISEYSKDLKDLQLSSFFIYNCNYNWDNWK